MREIFYFERKGARRRRNVKRKRERILSSLDPILVFLSSALDPRHFRAI
jgi:hypothetical protein